MVCARLAGEHLLIPDVAVWNFSLSPVAGLQDAYAPMRDPHGLLAAHRAAAGPVEAGLSSAAADDSVDVEATMDDRIGASAVPILVDAQGRRKTGIL